MNKEELAIKDIKPYIPFRLITDWLILKNLVVKNTPFTKEEYMNLEHSCCLYAHSSGWNYCPECGHALFKSEIGMNKKCL